MEVEEENVVLQAVMDPIRVGSDVARRLASSTAGDDSSLNDFAMMSNPDLFADQIARKQDDFVADMESDCEEGRYFIPVVGDEVTCVYSAVMNAFGGAGGFTALLNKLRNTQNGREGRLTRVLRVLEPMSRAHALVDRNGDFEAFGAAARAVIFRVILDLSVDELKAEDKVGIPAALRIASVLYPPQNTASISHPTIPDRGDADSGSENGEDDDDSNGRSFDAPRRDASASSPSVSPPTTLDKEADTFLLALALKRLKSPVLEVRLKGLARVKERITRTDSPESLCNTLRDGGVVESVFTRENLHVEVVKRCEGALRFLAHWRGLSEEQINLIWNATSGSHENLVHAVYTVVQGLPQHLSPELCEHLWQKIKSIPLAKYDAATVVMLATFTFFAISAGNIGFSDTVDPESPDKCSDAQDLSAVYGIPILLELISDHASVGIDVFQEAFTNLKNLVSWPRLSTYRHLFASICIQSLARHESVLQSLHLLRAVLETYETGKSEQVIWLDKQCDLFRVGLADYVFFSRNFEQSNGNVSLRWAVEENFSQRLAFLSFILSCDLSMTVDEESIALLWTCVTAGGVDRDHVLCWFETNLARIQRDGLTERLFKLAAHYFSQPEVAKVVSPPGLNLLRRLCKLDGENEDAVINAMWGIALLAGEEEVSRDAGAFLTTTYVWTDEKRVEFLTKCMGSLVDGAAEVDESATRLIERVVAVLHQFIDEFDRLAAGEGISPPIKHGMISSGEVLSLGITVISGPPRFVLQINSNETLAAFRSQIAMQLKDSPNPSTLRLITSGKELKNIGKTLSELGISDQQQFHVTRRIVSNDTSQMHVSETIDQVPCLKDPSTQPATVLSRKPFFEQLLETAQRRSIVQDEIGAKRIWELLMILPTNETINKQMSMPCGWKEFLEVSHPFRLFYCLQILESKVDKGFHFSFVEEKGMKRLVEVFLEVVRSSRMYPSGCVALLLQIIRVYLEDGANVEEMEEFVRCIFMLVARDDDELVVRYALDSLVSAMSVSEDVIHKVFDEKDNLKSWLVHTLISGSDTISDSLDLRREVIVSAFSTIASHSSYACTILLSCMTTCMSEASRHTSPQFYELLQKLLFSTSMKQEENVETVQKCFQICSKEILAAESLSSIPSGLLTVTLTIIEFLETVETVNTRSSHQFILPDLTLHLNHLLSAPWGHAKVRHRAYGVLLRLCSTHCERNELLADVTNNMENRTENGRALLQFIANHLIELHQKTSPVTMGLNNTRFQWSYYPIVLEKTSGFVGLKNLGATCYMNSLLQLLFMSSRFRIGLLLEADKADPDSSRHDVFDRLVETFSYLIFSKKRFFDPNELFTCFSVSPTTQMDVDEYLNMLFDKIEGRVKELLLDCFGGSLINQVKCRDVEFVSEREENFYVLSLDVKDKRNILDSLEFYVRGEVLDGDNQYYCSPLNRRVDAVKRVVIGRLPRMLILHLKRFEFDFDVMQKTKVNDFCEFPVRLDMSPYMKQKSGDDIYILEGILVHSGTAESGHYYSFVKEGVAEKWFQFNDVSIEPFDPCDIPSACFGGTDTIPQFDPLLLKSIPEVVPKTHSAYMLFYQREALLKEEKNGIEDPCWTGRVQALQKKIEKENELFEIDRVAFDSQHCEFVKDFSALEGLDELAATRLLVGYVLDVLCRSRDRSSLAEMTQRTEMLLKRSPVGSEWFTEKLLDSDLRWARAFLLSPVASHDARAAFSAIVRAALGTLGASSTLVARFVEVIVLGLLTETDLPSESLAALAHSFCAQGPAERALMLQCGAVMHLIGLFELEDEDKEAQPKLKKSKTDNGLGGSSGLGAANDLNPASPATGYIMASLALIVADTTPTDGSECMLKDEEKALFTSSSFIRKVLQDGAGVDSLVKILYHLSCGNAETSSRVVLILADAIGIGAADTVLNALLELDDAYADLRRDLALRAMIHTAEEDETAIGALIIFTEESQVARNWILDRVSEPWLEKWMFAPSRTRRESAGEIFISLGTGVKVLYQMAETVAKHPTLATSYLRTLRSLAPTNVDSDCARLLSIAMSVLSALESGQIGEDDALDEGDESRLEALHLLLDLTFSERFGIEVANHIGNDEEMTNLLLNSTSTLAVNYMLLHALAERNQNFASTLEHSKVPDEALKIGIVPSTSPSGQQQTQLSPRTTPSSSSPQLPSQLRQAAQWLLSSASERSPALRFRHQAILIDAESLSIHAFVYLRNGLLRDAVDATCLRDRGGIDALIEKHLAPCLTMTSLLSERKFLCDANASGLIIVKATELLRSVGEKEAVRDEAMASKGVMAAICCLRLARLVLPPGFREPFHHLIVSFVSMHLNAAQDTLCLLEEQIVGVVRTPDTDGSSSPSTKLERLDLSNSPSLPQYLSADAGAITFAVAATDMSAKRISTVSAEISATKILATLLAFAASMAPSEAPLAHEAAATALRKNLESGDRSSYELIDVVLTKWREIALRRARLLFETEDAAWLLRMSISMDRERGDPVLPQHIRWDDLGADVIRLAESVTRLPPEDDDEKDDEAVEDEEEGGFAWRRWLRSSSRALATVLESGVQGDRAVAQAALRAVERANEKQAMEWLVKALTVSNTVNGNCI